MMSKEQSVETASFEDLGLPAMLLKSVKDVGYESPSPIQSAAIPVLMRGADLIGQAQTGTGKTAAFALPLLAGIDCKLAKPQLLVLTPTRELALQVSEAIQTYAKHLPGLHVLPVYGGQGMETQLRGLSRGVQVIVGTPGRVQDHLRRRTMDLSNLRALVLDEADEMLRMGFVEEVEIILEETPSERQTALFSATMPAPIQRIAQRFLREPEHIAIASKTATVSTIRQHYVAVTGYNKLEALTRILEAEAFDAMLIFVRTRTATVNLADKLEARGFAASPLSGEMSQDARQRTVDRLKEGKIDVIICTDVAARGLDVERVSHVVNYDIPADPESYVHRIGRTGRAGREGQAILFVAKRERRLLKLIERTTRQPIERMGVPSGAQIGEQRINELKALIAQTIEDNDLAFYEALVERHVDELWEDGDTSANARSIAAAMIYLHQQQRPLIVPERSLEDSERGDNKGKERLHSSHAARYRMDVGSSHGLEVKHVVGCIANEAGIPSRQIGKIRIEAEYSTVELPSDLSPELMDHLARAWTCGRQLKMTSMDERPEPRRSARSQGAPYRARGGSRDRGGERERSDRPRSGDRARGGDRSRGGDRDQEREPWEKRSDKKPKRKPKAKPKAKSKAKSKAKVGKPSKTAKAGKTRKDAPAKAKPSKSKSRAEAMQFARPKPRRPKNKD
jgi:ATP-dependent RNA helicase DeaD